MRAIASAAILLIASGIAAAATLPEKSLTPKKTATARAATPAPAPAAIAPTIPPTAAAEPAPAAVPAPANAPEPAATPKKSGAKSGPLATVLDYGYYELEKEGDRYAEPSIPSGEMIAGATVRRVALTNTIPLQKGRLFGFRFRIAGLENRREVEVREVVRHPRMVKPDKTRSTGYEVKLGLNVRLGEVTDYAGYRLDHDYEMVEGDWEFEFWLDDRKILEQKFTTVSQPPAPASASPATAR